MKGRNVWLEMATEKIFLLQAFCVCKGGGGLPGMAKVGVRASALYISLQITADGDNNIRQSKDGMYYVITHGLIAELLFQTALLLAHYYVLFLKLFYQDAEMGSFVCTAQRTQLIQIRELVTASANHK